ncbi:MAG: ComEC/Rec2 family competence protein, partial [Clostridiales bacterium]|nr:ComEC/Rec2 family competence protein [Clostridiales bacterium]
MRRPIVYIFFAFTSGIWLAFHLSIWVVIVLSLLFIVASYILKKRTILFLLCLVLVGASYFSIRDSKVSPLEPFEGEIVDIRGCVESVQDMGRYYRLIVKSNLFSHEDIAYEVNKKIIINLSGKTDLNPQGLAGKDIEVSGKVSLPSGQRNPGLFDYKLYLKTRNIYTIVNAYFSNLEVLGTDNRLMYYLGQLKNNFSVNLDSRIKSESKGLLFGMLFGDKTLIDDNLYETFQRNGTSHILAVSGIHVGIVYLYLSKIFSNRKSVICSVIVMGLLFIYCALALFSPSVIRAVTMIGLHILAKHLHLRYDLVSSASFSALLMLIYNPYNLFNVGFQLSYLAVFSLGFFLPLVNSKIDKLNNNIISKILKIFAPVF